jgi:uncharacterized protein
MDAAQAARESGGSGTETFSDDPGAQSPGADTPGADTPGAHDTGVQNVTRGTVIAAHLEVAHSFLARFMGLMGRRSLAPGTALWLHGNGIHMFFMRFPIDAVFLGPPTVDGTRAVLSTHRRVRPWIGIVPLVRGAQGVLELPVGAIDASRTARGDLVRLAGDAAG